MNVAVTLPVRGDAVLRIRDAECVADVAGILYWPEQRLLVVSDLHLEKGSAFATRGQLVPPYDTTDTLRRLSAVVARYDPQVVVSLGDNFHDRTGAGRLAEENRAMLADMQRGRDFIWITGNHDPEPLTNLGGLSADSFEVGGVTFRHIAAKKNAVGEVSGHLHPVAIVAGRGRSMRRRCFAADGNRLVMPAFGAYAGGLSIRDRAFASIFDRAFMAHVLGEERVYAIGSANCL
jgi:uncharacterized protein